MDKPIPYRVVSLTADAALELALYRVQLACSHVWEIVGGDKAHCPICDLELAFDNNRGRYDSAPIGRRRP
ncbi:MAG TPA: hypothetical protein VKQ30_26380 [Ktedonobacterales bacterium]|nr:hypothetical protein [Ktedonobacterales bacterium]